MIDCRELGAYTRFEIDGTAVYVRPDAPDWFVPTSATDALLIKALAGGNGYRDDAAVSRLLHRVAPPPVRPHAGRAAMAANASLRECWLHITDRCTMSCTHCMFSSGRAANRQLPFDTALSTVDQAYTLGARIFYFTGGEPFIHPRFTDLCDHVLGKADTHVVVLTNAATVQESESWLRRSPAGRLHLQVSIDGCRENHDAIRGEGAYECLEVSLRLLRSWRIPVTLAMSVTARNATDMLSIVTTAHRHGIGAVHYLWLFKSGRARTEDSVDCDTLARGLIAAYEKAKPLQVTIDNIEVLRSQVFTVPGTRFDLGNGGWESLAVGPDGSIYPSPALIGTESMRAGSIDEGLQAVWRQSPVLDRVRHASLLDDPSVARHPLRFLIGGGDTDHSFHAAGTLVGGDPYLPLYSRIALHLIAEHARSHDARGDTALRCRMGERLHECGPHSSALMFTHSNCVQSISDHDSHTSVRSFYSRAAERVNEEILNPIGYGEETVAHIPPPMRVRSYGCGSPVLDCDLAEGRCLVDLGSGTGIECFIASKLVGPSGRVYGVDMSDTMLDRARLSLEEVAVNLGYRNVAFRKGYLEALPLDNAVADVVVSNCVINLTPDKRRVFEEIRRVLKPGGRLCISDIVTASHIPVDMKYDERLRGECLGGAMLQEELFAMLEELGFEELYLLRRYEYRRVRNHPFYSITYRAVRPGPRTERTVVYRGPLRSVRTEEGEEVPRGATAVVSVDTAHLPDESFFVLDDDGAVVNVEQQTACGVFVDPAASSAPSARSRRRMSDCMVCGAPLDYSSTNREERCHYCGRTVPANARCRNGHFVCDRCHGGDAREIIARLCTESTDTDPLALLHRIRAHPALPMHGPEHHMLVPAVLVAAYRNTHGGLDNAAITTAIERGATIAGGACAFLGACGAAMGVGTAFSVILGGTPFEGAIRKKVQEVTADVLGRIARYDAARCCRRDCTIAVRRAVELSARHLPHALACSTSRLCTQQRHNEHCLGAECPSWPRRTQTSRDRSSVRLSETASRG